MRTPRMRAAGAVVTTIALLAGCSSSTTTSAPSGTGSPVASAPDHSSAEPTSFGGHWESAGAPAFNRYRAKAVELGDGRVLVIGEWDGVTEASPPELWDPATGVWQATAPLNKLRSFFAAVALQDGRALVTGGLNDSQQSFSSTYVFDPDTETWTKVGLLGTARTAPSADALSDGRVLVAGGYFHVAYTATAVRPEIMLAAYHPPAAPSMRAPTDMEPKPVGSAMATAELFDPATGTWSPTGPLTYARVGAAAVTLSDGRILVIGSTTGPEGGVDVAPGAFGSSEIYDPATGRFGQTGGLPDIDRAALEAQGAPGANPIPDGDPEVDYVGTLVALDDGGAVLVGYAQSWKHEGDITRSFRYDPTSGTWKEIGQTYIAIGEPSPVTLTNPGAPDLTRAAVARLSDGSVLIAESSRNLPTLATHRYEPATNTWSELASMPEPGGAVGPAVVLADGSIFILILTQASDGNSVSSAIRFVPGS
jgi:hypothetical protein